MSNKYVGIALVVVVILAIGAYYFPEVVNQEPLGAIPGTDLPAEGKLGGLSYAVKESGLQTATSTVCALKAPTYGTTTLAYFHVDFTTASTSAHFLEIGKDATPFATTTSLGTATLGVNQKGRLVANDPEGSAIDEATVFSPGQWVVVKSANTISDFTGNAFAGNCRALFYGVE